MRKRPKSEIVYGQLCEVIPGGVNSPVRSCLAMGQLPLVAERALGDKVYDVDGHEYIDFCSSWGAIIHGHCHPIIIEAVQKRMGMGTTFGITTPIEEKLARKITQLMPNIEKIRFVSSGTEATMTAARLARGYTGRKIIIKFGGNYHGHADFFLLQAGSGLAYLSPTSSSAGVPDHVTKDMLCLRFNDTEQIREVFNDPNFAGQIAAVILEPIAGNMGVILPEKGFLEALREETAKHGALLIFDEVMTGFRVGLEGAQGKYGIKPDLTCLAKVIGGGFPAAAFGGKKEIMDCLAPLGSVYQAGTLSGNPLAMEAGLQALQLLETPAFFERMEEKTKMITEPVIESIKKKNLNACVQQAGSMATLFFGKKKVINREDTLQLDLPLYAKFFRYMFDHGVYLPPAQQEPWFLTDAHEESSLSKTRDHILDFLKEIT